MKVFAVITLGFAEAPSHITLWEEVKLYSQKKIFLLKASVRF